MLCDNKPPAGRRTTKMYIIYLIMAFVIGYLFPDPLERDPPEGLLLREPLPLLLLEEPPLLIVPELLLRGGVLGVYDLVREPLERCEEGVLVGGV